MTVPKPTKTKVVKWIENPKFVSRAFSDWWFFLFSLLAFSFIVVTRGIEFAFFGTLAVITSFFVLAIAIHGFRYYVVDKKHLKFLRNIFDEPKTPRRREFD